MAYALLGVGMICMLVAFVCSILVIVKMFQNNQTGIGVASIVGMFICGFGYILTMIYGWKNKDGWRLQTVMPIYSICLVVGIILYAAGYAMILPELMKLQQQGGV